MALLPSKNPPSLSCMLLAVTIVGRRKKSFLAWPRSTWPQRPEPSGLGLATAGRRDRQDMPFSTATLLLERKKSLDTAWILPRLASRSTLLAYGRRGDSER